MKANWRPTWTALDGFPAVPGGPREWRAEWASMVDPWLVSVRALATQEANVVTRRLAEWDERLRHLGGDPVRKDWRRFRPLRLSREEDWSDWLAHLVEQPEGCRVAAGLFPPTDRGIAVEMVKREQPLVSGHRADLILFWSVGRAAHVEVKVGDQNFAKTEATGQGCRETFTDREGWVDYILLPDEDEEAWLLGDPPEAIKVVTWSAVARALRRELLQAGEPTQWAAFAHAFCGAIEQVILGMPAVPAGRPPPGSAAALLRLNLHLEETTEHG